MLHVIIVWYNEEINLPKCFESLKNFDWLVVYKIHYADQSSNDKSIEIAKIYTNNVYLHQNFWFCEASRKLIFDKECDDSDRILLLDADEEISQLLAREIREFIHNDNNRIWSLLIDISFMWVSVWKVKQNRLFLKDSVSLLPVPHSWIQYSKDIIIGKLDNILINNNLREVWSYNHTTLDKTNRYTTNEVNNIELSINQTIFRLIFMPILWFFWFGIQRWLFFKWIKWWIYCIHMWFYQFIKYAKLYEKHH
jgi:glycosyltransferase involved in cell wall biosynthesis